MEKQKSIGGLWKKTTKGGKELLTGNIEIDGKKIKIACWLNEKTKENQPDYRIYIDTYEKPQQEIITGNKQTHEDLSF